MQFSGSVNILASQDRVWEFLTDLNQVSQCVPGLESFEIVEPDKVFKVVAAIGLGNIKAKFNLDVEWLELDKPSRALMKAHGVAPGSAVDVTSEMLLSEGEDGSTDLNWSADIQVLGTIASLASRMMAGVTQKLSGEFFECAKTKIEG